MQKHVNGRHFEDSMDNLKSSRFGRDDQNFGEDVKNDVINIDDDDDDDDDDSDDEDCVIQPSPPAKSLKTSQFTSVFAKRQRQRQQQLAVINSANNNQAASDDNTFECPICAFVCDGADILNLHV